MEEISEMTSDALLREASSLLRSLAAPAVAGESIKACQLRVHRRLKTWSPNRVRDLWRPDPRARVQAHEIEQLRQAAAKRRADNEAGAELRELKSRIERLENLLLNSDPEMHRPDLAALGQLRGEAVRALGPRDRSEPE